MACRVPGAPNLAAFWDLLVRGEEGIDDGLPPHLRAHDWSPVRRAIENDGASRLGGFLEDIEKFDAEFFGFSEHEVLRMSPAHRLLFEVVWDAIDDAGIPCDTLAGTHTSVFTSCMLTPEYWDALTANDLHDLYAVVGAATFSTAAGRLAYVLDLRGPTMAVDSTCSSSLLAVHLACASIRAGESTSAIVGSVNLQLSPALTTAFGRGRVLSPRGRCRFGDQEADGYVRSDGALAVLLKPLSAALAAGDRIYAAIVGSGSSGIGRAGHSPVAPSAPAQRQAITLAYAQAGLSADDVDYVEAHGTGTVRGDEAELTALTEVFGETRSADDPCLIGSVKSNIGHTEGAAGLAGLVKTALAVANGTIPPTLCEQGPNDILAGESPLSLVRHARPWPARGSARIAGVTSIGISGTNVHLVLVSVGEQREQPAPAPPREFLLPVSARAPEALTELAARYAERLDRVDTLDELHDLVHSAAARRTHYEHRLAVTGTGPARLAADLRAFAAGEPVAGTHSGRRPDVPGVVFVCAGGLGQWHAVGHSLLTHQPVFLQRIQECDKAVHERFGWSLLDRLAGNEPRPPHDSAIVLWALRVALAAVWQDWGVEPNLVVGDGLGELAAATIRGTVTLRDAATLLHAGEVCPSPGDPGPLARAVREMAGDRHTLVVTLGADNRLTHALERATAGTDTHVVASTRAGRAELSTLLDGLATAYVHGTRIDWSAVYPHGRYVPLPGYPWQRRRYWVGDDLGATCS